MKFFIEMRESVINFKFYNDIRRNRYGKVFGYLAILLLIVYTLLGVSTYIVTNKILDNGISYLKNDMPEFSIANGELDWKGQPLQYFIHDTGITVAVDANSSLDETSLDKENTTYFVFTKDSILMKNAMQKQKVTYKELSADFTKADVINLAGKWPALVITMIVLVFPFYYGIKLLNVLILASIAAVSAAILKLKISWRENFIISGYALTLPLLLGLLFNLAGVNFPMIAYWLISILYVAMAQRYIRLYEFAAAEAILTAEKKMRDEEMSVEKKTEAVNEEEQPSEIYKVSDGSDTDKKEEE